MLEHYPFSSKLPYLAALAGRILAYCTHPYWLPAVCYTFYCEVWLHPYQPDKSPCLPKGTLGLQFGSANFTFNNYLGTSRHLQVHGLTFNHLYRFTRYAASHCELVHSDRKLRNSNIGNIRQAPNCHGQLQGYSPFSTFVPVVKCTLVFLPRYPSTRW